MRPHRHPHRHEHPWHPGHGRHCHPPSGAPHARLEKHPRLQRRIFMWLGATILLTGLIVGCLFRVLAPTERWQQDAQGFTRFVSARVASTWHDPYSRRLFIEDVHRDLRFDATLRDAHGRILERAGEPCARPWGVFAINRGGRRLGTLEVCGERYPPGGWRFVLVLIVALVMFWGASGLLARRLLRPLRRLERMAKRIGEGDLSARANLTPERHGELGVLGVTLNEMASRIERQLADQRELLAAVSHELRTPLGHLRVLVEMARDRPQGARIDEIEREVLEIDALVGQLLASSRLDFGSIEEQPVDAIELAERALERAGLQSDRLAVEGEPGPLRADPTLIARALGNLLANAEQHGGGAVLLEVRFEPERVLFAVEDRGPGFGKEEREKVFEPFYRGEHRAGASLGLGLSLVRRIAHAHGGRAYVEDPADGGARVVFWVVRNPEARQSSA